MRISKLWFLVFLVILGVVAVSLLAYRFIEPEQEVIKSEPIEPVESKPEVIELESIKPKPEVIEPPVNADEAFAEAKKEMQELMGTLSLQAYRPPSELTKTLSDTKAEIVENEAEIAEIDRTFFQHHEPMQKYLDGRRSFLKRLVSTQKSTVKKIEKNLELTQKSHDKIQIYQWLEEHREEITKIINKAGARGDELTIINLVIGSDGFPHEHAARILEALSDKE